MSIFKTWFYVTLTHIGSYPSMIMVAYPANISVLQSNKKSSLLTLMFLTVKRDYNVAG